MQQERYFCKTRRRNSKWKRADELLYRIRDIHGPRKAYNRRVEAFYRLLERRGE
jgi:hypothetical protein